MQIVDGALQRESTMPRRRGLNMLAAVVVISLMVALLVWVAPFGRSRSTGRQP
jgi:ferric-dicitrate binding protein FerR (iron transport regulator)